MVWVHRQDRARPRDGTNGIIVCLRTQWAVAVDLFGGWTVLSRLQVLCGELKSGDEVAGVDFGARFGAYCSSFVHCGRWIPS
jgi:hypothetical protein